MRQMTSSQAKQNFGELLDAASLAPVAIARHKKVKAIVCSPEAYRAQEEREVRLDQRRAARAAQVLVDKDRLIKHQQWAIELLLLPKARQKKLIDQARREVLRWRQERLCSADYCDRWEALLDLPATELARAMACETLDWGIALRQNSPWHVVAA